MKIFLLFTFFFLVKSADAQQAFAPMYDSSYYQAQMWYTNTNNSYQKSVDTGDLNEDGYPDIAFVGYGNLWTDTRIALQFGNCIGTLGDSLDTLFVPNIANPAVIEMYDMNNDNHLDLTVGGEGWLIFYAGDGLGNFSQPVTSLIPNSTSMIYECEMTAGDFNADGMGDIFISSYGFGNNLMIGNGAGSFTDSGIDYNSQWTQNVTGPKVGIDVNNDGLRDVVNAKGGIYLNSATGIDTVPTGAFHLGSLVYTPRTLIVVQSDTDQVLEVFCISDTVLHYGEMNLGASNLLSKINPNGAIGSMAVGDFDKDGFVDDVFLLMQDGTKKVYRGSNGLLTPFNSLKFGTIVGWSHIVSVDINQDGLWDIYETVDQRLNINFGNFRFSSGNKIPVNGTVKATCSADFDKDGYDDIAVSQNYVGKSLAIAYTGPCGVSSVIDYAASVQLGRMATGYLNNDTLPDLVIGSNITDSVFIFMNQGNRNFSRLAYYCGHYLTYPLVHDFNEDGYDDVFLLSTSPGVYNLLFSDPSGSGVLTTPTPFYDADAIPGGVLAENPAKGDFNGDGHMDFVVSHNNAWSQYNTVHYGDGTGMFPVKTPFGFLSFVTDCVPIHLNPDSQIDMICSGGNFPSAATALICIDSATAQLNACTLALPFKMQTITVNDFNNDSINDFIGNYYNSNGESAPYLLKPDYSPYFTSQLLYAYQSRSSAGKFNGDDFNDLVHFNEDYIIPYSNNMQGNPSLMYQNDTLYMALQRGLSTITAIEWYKDHVLIPGATQPTLPVTGTGYYQVAVYHQGGSMGSAAYEINSLTGIEQPLKYAVDLYPNPAIREIVLHSLSKAGPAEVTVYDVNGKLVWQNQVQLGSADIFIQVEDWNPGLYFVVISSDNQVVTKKLVKL